MPGRRGRERTLAWAAALSAFAPIVTGAAVVMSQSSTQIADFVRRSVELLALLRSWWVYRTLSRAPSTPPDAVARLERRAGLAVALALGVSGLTMLVVTSARLGRIDPGGDVRLGLAVACLAVVFNGAFWWRYERLQRACADAIIDAQRRFYRAKVAVDLNVIVALCAVAFAPGWRWTAIVDSVGSLAVAGYVLIAALQTARAALRTTTVPTARSGHEQGGPG